MIGIKSSGAEFVWVQQGDIYVDSIRVAQALSDLSSRSKHWVQYWVQRVGMDSVSWEIHTAGIRC